MLPQNRPHFLTDRPTKPVHPTCHERGVALDLLQGFSLPDACSIEHWLDRIEALNGREMRP